MVIDMFHYVSLTDLRKNKGLFSDDLRVFDMFVLFEKCRDGL